MIVISIVWIIAATAWSFYNEKTQQKMELNIAEWECSDHERRSYRYPVRIGDITTIQTGYRTECVEWQQK